ncbi:hypothetical protein HQ590_04565 [bacterium]|nr:hypothetical protein [bacterium]
MKRVARSLLIGLLLGTTLPGIARAEQARATAQPTVGVEAATTIAKITGVAISPMLGVGVLGAWDYFRTPGDQKADLPWYARPLFWVPALLLVGAVALKDAAGTAVPPGLKKPLDVAETIENKVSGLVAVGAFVPLIATFFPTGAETHAAWAGAGFAAISFGGILNWLLTPLAMAAFVLVWLAGHAITVLILISPFGVVDAALKACRTFLLSLVTVTSFANPLAGAILSLIVIVIAYFVAGWSFRLTVFGSVFIWDFLTGKRKRFHPAPNGNWLFCARKLERTPIRTYGRLVKTDQGQLTFVYRPWLVFQERTLTLPAGTYAVGRGLFYPELMQLQKEGGEERARTMFLLSPWYRTHEEELAGAYGLGAVRDVGLLRGFKALWRWVKGVFGVGTKAAPAPAAT